MYNLFLKTATVSNIMMVGLLLQCFVCLLNVNAQNWEISFGDEEYDEYSTDVCSTNTTGFYLLSERDNSDSFQTYLSEIDHNGNVISHTYLWELYQSQNRSLGLVNIGSDELILAGNDGYGYWGNGFVAKINTVGDTIWTKTYSEFTYAHNVQKMPDGGLLLTEYNTDYHAYNSSKVVKMDTDGNIEWVLSDITDLNPIVCNDGSIVCLKKTNANSTTNLGLTKIDANGNILWTKPNAYSINENVVFEKGICLDNGDFLYVGYTSQNKTKPATLQFDATGNFQSFDDLENVLQNEMTQKFPSVFTNPNTLKTNSKIVNIGNCTNSTVLNGFATVTDTTNNTNSTQLFFDAYYKLNNNALLLDTIVFTTPNDLKVNDAHTKVLGDKIIRFGERELEEHDLAIMQSELLCQTGTVGNPNISIFPIDKMQININDLPTIGGVRFNVFPNPMSKQCTIDYIENFENEETKIVHLEIVQTNGQRIVSYDNPQMPLTINLENLPNWNARKPGMYFVKMTDELGRTTTKKVMVL